MRRKITIKDVAKEAGVSATTVSYVLNQNEKQTISEDTKARVLHAVEKLNYIPNYAARIMKNDESRCIGLVMNRSFKIGRFSTVVAGIMDELGMEGYRVLLCAGMQKEGQYSGYLEDYFRHHLDGLIFICNNNQGPTEEDQRVIEMNQLPVVVFDSLNESVPYGTVDFDYYNGAVSVVDAMITPAMKRLIYIRPFFETRQEQIRENAFADVMKQYPNISYEIIKETEETDALWRKDERKEFSRFYTSAYKRFLETHVIQSFKGLQPEDGVIVSWGILLPMIRDLQVENGIKTVLGTMAQMQEDGWGGWRIVYGDYHNYQAGKTCARLLLDNLGGYGVKGIAPKHKILPVEVRGIDR